MSATRTTSILSELEVWNPKGELRYELSFPIETPSNNVIKGLHFRDYGALRKQWKMLVQRALQGQVPGPPIARSFLLITRECAGGGLDWDNAYGGLKPMLDCLVKASTRNPDGLGLILDDNIKAMPLPPFIRQLPSSQTNGSTTVRIYELLD